MLEIPENIKDLFRQDRITEETKKKLKLTFPEIGLTIENDRIESESMVITESLCESEDLEFGSCDSSTFEIIVADILQDVTGHEFSATIECGGYKIPLGMYTVESFTREADRRRRRITAYDRMRKFNTDASAWYNGLSFPMTLKAFRNSLCSHIGIGQDSVELPCDSIEIKKTVEPKELSGLDVLKCICQINGCFGHMSRSGFLKYIFLSETGLYPSEALFPEVALYPSEFGGDSHSFEQIDSYKEMTYEDYEVEGISGVIIRQEEKDAGASVGQDENLYIIEGNFLLYGKTNEELEEIGNKILLSVGARTYRPVNAIYRSRPWMEVGDQVRIPTRDDSVETFIMKRSITGIQALMDNIESTGKEKREEVFGIGKQIIQIEGRTAIIEKNVGEVSVSLLNLSENTETKFKATENAINLKVSKGDVSSEISVESGDITISGDRFSWSATNSSMTKDGLLTCNGGTFKGDVIADNFKVNSGIKIYLGDQTQYADIAKLIHTDSAFGKKYYALQIGAPTETLINVESDSSGETLFSSYLSGVTIPTRLDVSEGIYVQEEVMIRGKGLSGVSGLIIKGGSSTKSVGASTSIKMFSSSEMNLILGVYNSSPINTMVLFSNADGSMQDAHIDGSTYVGGAWYATTNKIMNAGNFKVGWVAIYFG